MNIIDLPGTTSHRIGHIGPLLVVATRADADLEGIEAVIAAQHQLIAAHGHFAMVVLSVQAPRAPPPESLARIRRNEEEIKHKSLGTVTAVLERGVAAAMTRTFMGAISLVMQNKMQVVKTVDEAALRIKALAGLPSEIADDTQLVEKFEAFIAS